MTGREWKPGDVAMVTHFDSSALREAVAVRQSNGWRCAANDALHRDGEGIVTDARPLVVIDPEGLTVPRVGGSAPYTTEDLARTLRLLVKADHSGEQTYRARIVSELADVIDPPAQPKPDEPTGLGAVVEDDKGYLWIRSATSGGDPWRREGAASPGGRAFHMWSDFAAVRVLSEGVTP